MACLPPAHKQFIQFKQVLTTWDAFLKGDLLCKIHIVFEHDSVHKHPIVVKVYPLSL